jgi:hypothetical protein
MTIASRLLTGAAALALSAAATQAFAEDAAPAATQADAGANQPSDIVVTGSARAQRRFGVSYAVNAMSQEQIAKLAPRSMAELIGALPGIQVEPPAARCRTSPASAASPPTAAISISSRTGCRCSTNSTAISSTRATA